jgi:hypothetical protein
LKISSGVDEINIVKVELNSMDQVFSERAPVGRRIAPHTSDQPISIRWDFGEGNSTAKLLGKSFSLVLHIRDRGAERKVLLTYSRVS